MQKILIATHNNNKRKELKFLLKEFKNTQILNLEDLRVKPPMIVEDGKTFRQNAVKKAVTVSRFFDGFVLADDSGLEVDALDGKPGVRSARFARAKATDPENNKKLLKLLSNTPDHQRKAQFVCCITLAKDGILMGSYEGKIRGRILFDKRGSNGFGYDPLFVPSGKDKTFAEMLPANKNRISHRALALKKLKKAIVKYIGPLEEVLPEKPAKRKAAPKKKTVAKKPVAKKAAAKKAVTKKAVVKKTAPKKPAAKKVVAKKAAPKKAAVKKPAAKKVVAKKTAPKKKPIAKKPAAKKVTKRKK